MLVCTCACFTFRSVWLGARLCGCPHNPRVRACAHGPRWLRRVYSFGNASLTTDLAVQRARVQEEAAASALWDAMPHSRRRAHLLEAAQHVGLAPSMQVPAAHAVRAAGRSC